jgi:DNA-binding LacI/PurR family transcriptional regulator
LLSSACLPTATVFDNDLMAMTALGVAGEFGQSVPRDLPLLTWDDSQLCQLTRPALSAMRHDIFSFGAHVTQTLFDALEERHPVSHPVQVTGLLPRASTDRLVANSPLRLPRHHVRSAGGVGAV